jgi:hypothetical protein
MRYFLCSFDQFSLGVPEDAVAAIMIYPKTVTEMITREEELPPESPTGDPSGSPAGSLAGRSGDVFFSLPHFFELADKTVRHGIVLKAGEEGPRQVLLVRTVEREADIAPEDMYPLPQLLTAPGKEPFLKGISFAGQTMIAFIEPAALIARILQARMPEERGLKE